ncbi:hypothetical protein ACGFIV_31235 [Sphaerisporangium sp. NPDC049003]|uniref:hypothetical protein n=1 Tax=Sphaerisporangium sp. NPDC049003 TaxID=3364517 RepID=UPI0037137FB1
MADLLSIPNLIKYVGVLVSIAGIFIATPAGTIVMWIRGQRWTKQRIGEIKSLTAWIFPRKGTSATIRQSSAAAILMLGGRGSVIAAGSAWSSSAPVSERVEKLHEFVTDLQRGHSDLKKALRDEESKRREDIRKVNEALAATAGDLRELIARNERDAARIDGRGLPVLGLGILLTNLTEFLGANLPIACGTTLLSCSITTYVLHRSVWMEREKVATA